MRRARRPRGHADHLQARHGRGRVWAVGAGAYGRGSCPLFGSPTQSKRGAGACGPGTAARQHWLRPQGDLCAGARGAEMRQDAGTRSYGDARQARRARLPPNGSPKRASSSACAIHRSSRSLRASEPIPDPEPRRRVVRSSAKGEVEGQGKSKGDVEGQGRRAKSEERRAKGAVKGRRAQLKGEGRS